jgi:Uma2 family endonuclease
MTTTPTPRPDPDDEPDAPVGPMTLEQYLAFEEASEVRHEFVGGYAYPVDATAMSGGTRAHNRIVLNVAGQLWLRTRGTGCETYDQSFKLRTPRGDVYYPDVMVSCGPTPPDDALYLDDPCLAVEVLSPSTARTDQNEKAGSYREVPSLGAYLVVETAWRAVHRRWRGADGVWRTETISGAAGAVPLPCPAGALTLDEIYEGTNLPPEPPTGPRLRRVREAAAAYGGPAA